MERKIKPKARMGDVSPRESKLEQLHTENFFEILLNQPKIRLYLTFSDLFGTKQTLVWFQINWKLVNTIWFRVDLIIFRKNSLRFAEIWFFFEPAAQSARLSTLYGIFVVVFPLWRGNYAPKLSKFCRLQEQLLFWENSLRALACVIVEQEQSAWKSTRYGKKVGNLPSHQLLLVLSEHLPRPGI